MGADAKARSGNRSFRKLLLTLPALLLACDLAHAQTRAPDPQFAMAQERFEALPEAERRAIQQDLIWTGHFNGAVSGSFGPLTFRAINALKGGRGAADGVLASAERQALAQAARTARDLTGFRIQDDARTGVRIGIPEKILPRRETTPNGGSRWQSADGKITVDATATPPGEDLAASFERATAVNRNIPGRKITYKLLRPDFFVVTGETPTGKFYRRLAAGPEGTRGFSIGYDKALAGVVDKLVIAIASSFEPFPSGPLEQPRAIASQPAVQPGPVSLPAPPRPTQRYGMALALSDKVALTAVAAVDGCRSIQAGGRPARLRLKDDASGLALLDLDGGGVALSGVRSEPLTEREDLVLVAYGDDAGKRAAMALPAQFTAAGKAPAVFAPLQPGQSGSPVFDRQGRIAGLVTANPSDKILIAGVAPQRAYALADGAALQGFAARAGIPLQPAPSGSGLSTGAIVERALRAVLPIVCPL
jgi:hypothetical protein